MSRSKLPQVLAAPAVMGALVVCLPATDVSAAPISQPTISATANSAPDRPIVFDKQKHSNFDGEHTLYDGALVGFVNNTGKTLFVRVEIRNEHREWVRLQPGQVQYFGGCDDFDDSLFLRVKTADEGTAADPHSARFAFDDPFVGTPSWGLHWRGEGWDDRDISVNEGQQLYRWRSGFKMMGSVTRANDAGSISSWGDDDRRRVAPTGGADEVDDWAVLTLNLTHFGKD